MQPPSELNASLGTGLVAPPDEPGGDAHRPQPLLRLRDLRVTLPTAKGPTPVLRGLDLALERGGTAALIGESGCGKSMTALALMGLLPEGAAVSGSIQLAARSAGPRDARLAPAQELVGLAEPAWCALRGARLAMVFQEPMTALNPVHTVGDQVAEPLRLHRGLSRREARARALELLDAVRLPDARRRLDAWPHQLSGGQRQRVGIAMALACDPDLLIADEPTTALDVTIQKEILSLLTEAVRERGMALLLISHDLNLVASCVEQVHVMYAGQVVESGPTREVFGRLAHPYTRGLKGARPRLGHSRGQPLATIPGRVPELTELPPGCSFSSRCPRVQTACHAGEPALRALSGGTPAHTARCIRADE